MAGREGRRRPWWWLLLEEEEEVPTMGVVARTSL
jgi:hypothetical protein